MFYCLSKSLLFLFLKLLVPIKFCGVENIPHKGPFVLAGNHVSYLDPLVLGVGCPRPINFMARDTLFRNPLLGWWMHRVNVIPLKRNTADVGAIKEALRRLKDAKVLLLFPEGTRSVSGNLGQGQEGVGFLVRKGQACVVPAFVSGTEKVLPRGSKRIRRAPVKVVYGRPIPFCVFQGRSDKEITQEIMQRIADLKEAALASSNC